MINVNQATKTAYLSDSTNKQLSITFPNTTIPTLTNTDLKQDTFKRTERVVAGENIEFVGCIATSVEFTVTNVTEDITGEYVEIAITSNSTQTIPLFKGYIDKVEQVPYKKEKKITAYDIIYKLSEVDIAAWYNGLSFPITIKSFRDSLFSYLNSEFSFAIAQVTTNLINDTIAFVKDYQPTRLAALDVIKSICQINCVFGVINRDGDFEYRQVPTISSVDQEIAYYKKADYQEYFVKPVDNLIVRVGEHEVGYGGGLNKYIINNNFFTASLDDFTLSVIAERLYSIVSGFTYQPVNADVNGLPYIECLDIISIPIYPIDGSSTTPIQTPFIVLERTISGIQALRDNFVAEGDEYQHEFVTDVSVEIEQLRKIVEYIQNDMDNLKFKYFLINNTEDIEIGDTETKTLIDNLRFDVAKQTVVVFQAEILLDVDTTADTTNDEYNDAVGEFTYTYNYNVISDYKPIETWVDGKHIAHLLKYFEIESGGINTLTLTLTMAGGSALIKAGHLRASLYGQNIVASSEWDGIIQVKDKPIDIVLLDNDFDVAAEAVSTNLIVPTPANASDTASDIVLYDVLFESADEEVTIEARADSLPFVTEDDDTYITEDGEYVLYSEGD